MLKFIALLALLIAGTYATQTGVEQIFAQMPATDFGKSIQALVQMHTTDNQLRLKEISDLLYEIQAIVDLNQKNADTFIEKNRNECTANIDTYEKQLSSQKKTLTDSQGELDDLKTEKTTKSTQLSNEKINNKSTGDDLDQAKLDFDDETNSFKDFSASFDEAIIACEEAIRLLRQLGTAGSAQNLAQINRSSGMMFVQLGQRFSDVKNILEQHVKKGGPGAFVQPIVDILTELSTQAHVDVDKVDQIITLIQTLLTRLREGLLERKAQNENASRDLQALIGTLTTAFDISGRQIGVLETRLVEIDTRITELTGVISNTEDMIVTQEKLIKDTKDDCEEEETRYATETSQRTSNLALLDKLIEHFESEVTSTTTNVREGQIQ